ncbi:MAG TPA: pilus assembly protein TadG-related protein [Reyranella sp.]|jgi:Flp pilus assembly protein TadG|nr:pilus assembly protein TadG-related protein [Reyranella sp.]
MLRMISRKFAALHAMARRLGRDEVGSIATFLIVVPVAIGTAALGIETGQLYRVKRQMQSAADAAAIAGSIDRINGLTSTTITTDAKYASQRNGFTDATNGVSVTVNSPPTSGSYTGSTTAVEVIITKPASFSLGAVLNSWLGKTNASFTMRARSVAAQKSFTQGSTTGQGCIVALTTAAEAGVRFSNFNTLTSDCAIMSNGSATGTGTSASVDIYSFNNATVSQVWTRGSYSTDNASHITPTPSNALTNQSSTIADPTASFANPSVGACTYTNYNQSSLSSLTINPGTYCGGLNVSSISNVYFTPGIYYVADGDMYLDSVHNVTCPTCTTTNGVAIVLTTATGTPANIGGVYISSDNNVSLSAGSSGTYGGILFYQDRRASVGTWTSTSKIFTVSSLNTATLTGAIYFPNNRIEIANINNFDNGNAKCTIWVGRYIKFSSLNNTNSGSCATYGTNPVSAISTTTVSKASTVE